MGLSRDQWFTKMQRWVPSWWFEEPHYQVAVLYAFAAVLEGIQEDCDDQLRQTFIEHSTAPILDLHGDERNLLRVHFEPDPLFSFRIRNIVNQSNVAGIKALVDALLFKGECTILEHERDIDYCGLGFFDRGSFLNRRVILNDRRYENYFTIVIPPQIPVSNSFCNQAFANRDNFLGTAGELPLDVLLNIIVTTVTNAKAAGVLYRLVEL